jgi:hypothetical protein
VDNEWSSVQFLDSPKSTSFKVVCSLSENNTEKKSVEGRGRGRGEGEGAGLKKKKVTAGGEKKTYDFRALSHDVRYVFREGN